MCGISGIIAKDRFTIGELVRMTNIVRHRGPDDEGYMVVEGPGSHPVCLGGKDTSEATWQSDTKYKPSGFIDRDREKQAFLGLGHRRLSVLDLSPLGHMPMCDKSERYWITYNGEIYNYIELRAELKREGYEFLTQNDTEVILAAYDKWGPGCQDHFIGMWAMAIYDSHEQTLFLSRDRFGIKPLYYWLTPEGTFCFASEIKQFSVLKGWMAQMNGQMVSDYLFHAVSDHTDETFFKGVYQLLPGYFIINHIEHFNPDVSGRVVSEKWYKPIYSATNLGFDESVEVFKTLFIDVIKMHLRSDVPIGSALSGGLDSSAIVCVVNRLLKESGKQFVQKTFSSESHDKQYSERQYMDAVIEALGVEAHFVYPALEKLDTMTPAILWHQDEPYMSQVVYCGFNLFDLASQNKVSVMLNGHGSDEYISAYGRYRKLRWKQYANDLQYGKLREDLMYYKVNGLFQQAVFYMNPLLRSVPATMKRFIERQKTDYRELSKIIDYKKLNAEYLYAGEMFQYDSENVQQIAHNKLFFNPSPKYLRYEDRNSMAHSIEVRVPFLDHRLVEFCSSLPISYLDAIGESKRILVHSMKNILPEKVRNRKDKQGFLTPDKRWVKKDNPDYFREKTKEAIQVTNGIIRPEALPYFDKIVSGSLPFRYAYLRFILFSEWIKLFNVK